MTLPFDELSRKAANGTLSADERAAFDEALRQHPERRFDVEWDSALHAQLDEKIAAMPALPGWERTEKLLLTQAAGVRGARGPGLLDRLAEWLASSLGLQINAQAVAVALIIGQAGVISLLAWQYSPSGEGVMRTAAPDLKVRGPLLRVSFRPDARESDLRRALAAVGAEIVGGPGQLGVYLVRIKDGSLAAAAQALREGGTTDLVEVVAEP